MAKESRGKWLTKGALKLLSYACIDGAAAGVVAGVVPLAMINPIVGGIIVAGSAIASMAVCDRVVDKYIDDKVDEVSNEYHAKVDPIVDSYKLIKQAKEIFEQEGRYAAKDFLKKNKFDDKQVEEIIESFRKKQ